MSKPVATSIHTEAPDSGASVTVLPGHLVADGAGYKLATSGTPGALFVADGAGYKLATAASNQTVAARLHGFGPSYILRATT